MSKEEKEKVIRSIYYDEDGFGSVKETYQNSKKVLDSITLNDVKQWMDKQTIAQLKPYKGFNSYVAHHPLQEIQIDIADFTKSGAVNNNFRYLFVAIDIFTKFCHAVPMKDRQPQESVRALKEVIDKMGVPENIYHDFEGSWTSIPFVKVLNDNKIRQITVTTPTPFAERMVQTIKNMIYVRLEGLAMEKQEWVNLLPGILRKYNNTTHSTIGMSPNEAKESKNHVKVFLNITEKAKYNRKYPPLKKGDNVRVFVKKTAITKGHDPRFSRAVHKVLFISADGKRYLLDNNTKKLYSRHELRKVEATETKDT